jgi:hypothetical protein
VEAMFGRKNIRLPINPMNSKEIAADLVPHLETAEKAVAAVKDPRLREIAFGRILDHLLASKNPSLPQTKPVANEKHSSEGKIEKTVSDEKSRSGPTGGLRALIDAGKLDTPLAASEIIDCLKQEGRHYARPSVMMGLLSLVRERVLSRMKEKEDKNWKYVVRR